MSKRTTPIIGITGGIGAGKSVVAQIFTTLGIPVYNADARAKWLINNHKGLGQALQEAFGPQVFNENGQLDRAWLAGHVFHDKQKVSTLNSLVHPFVGKDFAEWVAQHSQDYPYLLKEAALIFEAGTHKELDAIIVVHANQATRLERVLFRDPHRNKQQIEDIMQQQMPAEEKKKLADYVIDNDGARLLIPQVLKLHQKLQNK